MGAKMVSGDIFLPLDERWAGWVIDRCFEDPEVWRTHGAPSSSKERRIAEYVRQAIKAAISEAKEEQ